MTFEEKPNIAVLVLDTLRARNVSCYGYERETTPHIDRLAGDGIRYRNAYTVAPWTLPAHASLFTGRYPSEHGADADTTYLDDTYPVLAEELSAEGYSTVGVSNNLWLSPSFGTTRGFDRFELMWQYFDTEDIAAPLTGHSLASTLRVIGNVFGGNPFKRAVNLFYGYFYQKSRDRAEKTNDRILDAVGEEPFFLFANYMEPHLPYRPPRQDAEQFLPDDVSYREAMRIPQEPWDYVFGDEEMDDRIEVLEALYDAAVAYLDRKIGELVDRLEERSDRPLVVVVLSDHGENIGDHGLMSHQFSLENTVLKIPLVVYSDELEPDEVSEQVDLIDVHATLGDLAGVDAPDGRGLFAGREDELCYAQYCEPSPPLDVLEKRYGVTVDDLDGREEMEAVIGPEHKLVAFSDRKELRENTDAEQAVEDTSVQERLVEKLEAWRDGLQASVAETTADVSASVKKRLEELGYY